MNPRDSDGRTALVHAALGGHLEVVQVLIDSGADLNARTNSGRTALYFAEKYGYADVVNVIAEHLNGSSEIY